MTKPVSTIADSAPALDSTTIDWLGLVDLSLEQMESACDGELAEWRGRNASKTVYDGCPLCNHGASTPTERERVVIQRLERLAVLRSIIRTDGEAGIVDLLLPMVR